jgi:hypothetical protein
MSNKIILCFLTVFPSTTFMNFINKLNSDNYSVYMCIDKNNYKIPDISDNNINIIKYTNDICESAGFKNTVIYFKNKDCSRDKALYYFCKNDVEFKYIWFIEEDVFIPSVDTIKNIDNEYVTGDLLCRSTDIQLTKVNSWLWRNVTNMIEPPYSSGMICAIRVSKNLLSVINNYATIHNTLFLDEAIFHTLTLQNNLKMVKCIYLEYITYKDKFDITKLKSTHLYHPMKNIELHQSYRNSMDK